MHLKLRDRVFDIDAATLSGFMTDPYWSATYGGGAIPTPGLAIKLATKVRRIGDDEWRPSLYNEWLSFPTRDWRDIADTTLRWRSADDEAQGLGCCVTNGALYAFEHADIHQAELIIGARHGAAFDIDWRGAADIFWDNAEYGAKVPFEAHARATFEGVTMNGNVRDDARSYRDRFAAHFNPDDFVQQDIVDWNASYEDGTGITSCKFLPRI